MGRDVSEWAKKGLVLQAMLVSIEKKDGQRQCQRVKKKRWVEIMLVSIEKKMGRVNVSE